MITESLASLSIFSDTQPAAALTPLLGIEPHDVREIGDLTWAGRNPGRSNGRERYADSSWSYTVRREQTPPDDETGFWSIRRLIEVFGPVADVLRELRPRYHYQITWSGFSDSWQGGFVIPADLFAGLAALDADLYGSAYLDSGDDGEDDD